jgi:hypothetical protein
MHAFHLPTTRSTAHGGHLVACVFPSTVEVNHGAQLHCSRRVAAGRNGGLNVLLLLCLALLCCRAITTAVCIGGPLFLISELKSAHFER